MREPSRESSRAIGSVRTMGLALYTMGIGAVRMAQQAVQLKRLKTKMLAEDKNVSKNGISARWQTYLGHPYHLLVIPGEPPTTKTCRIVKKR